MAAGQDGRQNFYPNDQQDLPQPDASVAPPPLQLEDAWVQPYSQDEEDYYSQAGDLYRIMTNDQQDRLAMTIAGGLAQAEKSVQERILSFLDKADPSYAARVAREIAS